MACCALGQDGQFQVSGDNGATYVAVGDLTSVEVNVSFEEIEVLTMSNAAAGGDVCTGSPTYDGTIEGLKCLGDPGQFILKSSFVPGPPTEFYFRLYESAPLASGTQYWEGRMKITSTGPLVRLSVNESMNFSYSVRVFGLVPGIVP